MDKKEGFSIVTVTNKKRCISNIIQNYDRQEFADKELIIVINSNAIKQDDFKALCKDRSDIWIQEVPEKVSLGRCLNIGCSNAKYNYIAKFDDDDYYGKYYLWESYEAFKKESCHIVCKSNIFYYLSAYEELIVSPQLLSSFKRARTGAGATICMTRETFKILPYSDLRQGIDLALFISARKMGLDIYTTTSYNFICVRSKNLEEHTWRITPESLKVRCDKKFGIRSLSLEEAYEVVSQYPV